MDYVADGDLDDSDADLPLAHQAAANGDTAKLMAAIKADPSVLQHQDAEGLTPLSHATMAEQLDSVKLLVKVGASINAQDNVGRTCLAMAAYQGWYDGVVFLLRNGAKDQICDKSGRSPLHSATYAKDTRVLSALLQRLSPDEVNLQDNEGMGSLHWACFHNRPEHTQLLLEKGTNPIAHDIDGKTPLQWAAQKGSVDCCRHLLRTSQGAALVNMADYSGKSPLHFAAAAGHADVIRELTVHHPVDIDCEDPDERTPLHWAAAMGQSQAVATLLELNASAIALDIEQGSPLDYARQSGNEDCIQSIEERLGLRGASDPIGSPEKISKTKNQDNKSKKGPLGFIVDFFKPRKNKNVGNDFSDESQITYNETSGSSGDSYTNNAVNRVLNSKPSPKHQQGKNIELKGSDNLISMKKLQLSREDNPVVSYGNGKMNHYELGDIQTSHSQNVPLGGTKGALPSNLVHVDLEHSHLIRSPPPAMKRGTAAANKLWVMEKDHGKLEEDAATILALQRPAAATNTRKQMHLPQTLQAPMSLQPIGQGSEDYIKIRSDTKNMRSHTVTPSLRYRNMSPGGDSVSSSKSQPAHLAPLKGPVPSQTQRLATTNPALNKVRKDIETETYSCRRTPTPIPPTQQPDQQTHTLSPCNSSTRDRSGSFDGSSSTPKRKKKKKKKTQPLDMMENHALSSRLAPRSLGDPYLDAGASRHDLKTSLHAGSSPSQSLPTELQ